ncbi:MAG: helicase, partial [Oscillospiraceae bacterium]
DVDETALSYAEIKALATGNPLIIVKCNLDMDISRLSTLKSYYLSQKYTLEGLVLRKYPQELASLAEREAGYVADIELLAANKKIPDSFTPMEILGTTHTEKEMAGKAILDACTKMTSPDAIPLGKYRGFSMSLCYDSNKNQYRLSFKGTLSHSISIGSDVFGNLTRIDNLLDSLNEKLENVQQTIINTKTQLKNARTEMQTPFAQEEELNEKIAKRNELNILLNMDEPENKQTHAPIFAQQECEDDFEM